MGHYRTAALITLATLIAGCTSDPYAPINRTTPIRQMDQFFGGGALEPAPVGPAYSGRPGYAPAYPRY